MTLDLIPVPHTTAELPGLGGCLKQSPEDFVVEERPAYAPSGDGEHLFLWVEKRGLSADDLLRLVSKRLGLKRRDIGCAGQKDTQAVTRQYLSVPRSCEALLPSLEQDNLRLLDVKAHGNKLKTGHLRGNDFRIRIRDMTTPDPARANAIGEALRDHGVANFYGPQRFGRRGSTLHKGLSLVRGETRPQTHGAFQRRFLISAVQSALFNQVLATRLQRWGLAEVLLGDVLQVVRSGGLFVCDDLEAGKARFDARDVVTTGPMFGPKMIAAAAEPASVESAALAEAGLSIEHFAAFGKLALGTRRPLCIWPQELSWRWLPESAEPVLELTFGLPSGAYGLLVAAEFIKEDKAAVSV